MAERAAIVIAFDNNDIDSFREILQKVKPIFADQENVQVFGAVKETATAIVHVLDADVEEHKGD